jgi:hypothetical protein
MFRVLFLIGLFTASSLGFSASVVCPNHRCIAVVDAGNAASKLQIYSYDLDPSNTPIKIKKVLSKKIEPGFASINLNQRAINQYLSLLFSDVSDLNIPVYFYATSGMRKLSFSRQQTYYAKLNQWFTMQSQWKLVVAKTLKSQEEALYGWLAVNYERGALTSPSRSLVGVVDTGSGSVQIAFPVKNLQNINPNDIINLDLYGRHVSLFTHGFLGLGQDEIRPQYLDNGSCFPKHYPLPNGFSAAGDFSACEKLMKPLINDIHQVDTTVKSVIQSNPGQTWYIIGGLSAMLQEKPFTFGHQVFTNQEVALKANRQICQQDWSILGTIYPENKYIFAACLNASYFYSLFVEGFGIDKNQPIHYLSNKISTNNWSLGVVLCQDGRLCSIA